MSESKNEFIYSFDSFVVTTSLFRSLASLRIIAPPQQWQAFHAPFALMVVVSVVLRCQFSMNRNQICKYFRTRKRARCGNGKITFSHFVLDFCRKIAKVNISENDKYTQQKTHIQRQKKREKGRFEMWDFHKRYPNEILCVCRVCNIHRAQSIIYLNLIYLFLFKVFYALRSFDMFAMSWYWVRLTRRSISKSLVIC